MKTDSVDVKDSLGDRMKRYEVATRTVVTPRTPIIIRVDGKAFHTYTRSLKDPFDRGLSSAMVQICKDLCKDVQGAQLAYTQSDEASFLVHSYKKFASSAWFDGQVQKIVSVAASIAAATMTAESPKIFGEVRKAAFDARVFVLPEVEVCNYFVWRQQDCVRNSVQAQARHHFSHSLCNNKNVEQLKAMLSDAGNPWELLDDWKRFGIKVERLNNEDLRYPWMAYAAHPRFQDARLSVDMHLETEEL